MIKNRLSFDEALREYRKIVERMGTTKTQSEVSRLEVEGKRAMFEVQCEVGYIGYELKDAVKKARDRIRDELSRPVEKSVEKSVEKPKRTTKRTTKKTTKKEK